MSANEDYSALLPHDDIAEGELEGTLEATTATPDAQNEPEPNMGTIAPDPGAPPSPPPMGIRWGSGTFHAIEDVANACQQISMQGATIHSVLPAQGRLGGIAYHVLFFIVAPIAQLNEMTKEGSRASLIES